MSRCFSIGSRSSSRRRLGVEPLEPRRVLDCHGLGTFEVCAAGDSDGNGQFDQEDLVLVLQAGKYMTGQAADWGQGDFNGDGLFNQLDISTALQAGTYLQGVVLDDLSSLVAKLPAHTASFGPPIVISSLEQLNGAIDDPTARDAIADATDFARQKLLLFSWSGSGGDRLVGAPQVVAGQTNIQLRFQFGLTLDYRPHNALMAVAKDAEWHVDIRDRVIHTETATYQFVDGESQLSVSGGFAGVHDQYRIEGSLELVRSDDGTARFGQVDATLRGDGLSSLDGEPLGSVLNLSELAGLQTRDSTVTFTGRDDSGNAVIKLQLRVVDQSLTVSGGSIPRCCDFFQYTIDATATSSGR